MNKFFLFLLLAIPVISVAQNLRWVELNSFPDRNSRKDDLCFINSQTGWVIDSRGYLYSTKNGGYSWAQQTFGFNPLRCVGFTDSLNGFIGCYDSTNTGTTMFRTTNGGNNWFKVTNLPAPKPKGLCGIHCVNQNVIYAVGRIEGPAIAIKSTNGGNDWIHLNLNSLADRLVDVKFFTPDSGFVSGGIGPQNLSKAVILFTSNGGNSWSTKYTSDSAMNYQAIWKINFTDRNIGVCSFNQVLSELQFIKTTDGGMTWNLFSFLTSQKSFTQGIGFRNSNTGWIGGGAETFETTDGGISWTLNNFGTEINRIRFYSDTLAYAGGYGFYKYTADPNIGIYENTSVIQQDFKIYQNYPNPFNPTTIINYDVPVFSYVKINVYNSLGQLVRSLLESFESAGPHQISWDGKDDGGNISSSGVYYCIMEMSGQIQSRKMILLR